jgi:hypothetical protein
MCPPGRFMTRVMGSGEGIGEESPSVAEGVIGEDMFCTFALLE